MAFHMMLAQKLPEMAISPDEANQLAVALANYLRHSNAVVSQKTIDTLILVGAIGMIEGTRVMAIMGRKRAEKAGHVAAGPNVVPIDPAKFPYAN